MNRSDFPLLQNQPELTYLDSAATSQKPESVIKAISDFYTNRNANVHRGIYKLSEQATEQYEQARTTVADFINAKPAEVIFTSGTTMGINLLAEYYFCQQLNPGDVILVSEMEHHSNFLPWQQVARERQALLRFLKLTQDFRLDISELEMELRQGKVKVLALTQMSNVLGTINPIKELITKIRALSPQTKIVIDAAQSLSHIFPDVKDLDCDFLVASGHKIYGPTGIGFLYGKEELLQNSGPFFTGGGMISKVGREQTDWDEIPQRFEAGTPDIAGAIGLAAALDYIARIGKNNIITHEAELTSNALTMLQGFPEITLFGPAANLMRGPVFSFNVKGIHPHDLAELLDQQQIAVRAGHHCAQILHREVLGVPASVRLSLGIYNDQDDLEKFSEVLKKLLGGPLFKQI